MKNNKGIFLFLICIDILLFQNFLQEVFPLFRYFDESLALFGFLFLIFELKKKSYIIKIHSFTFKILKLLFILLLCGLVPIFIYKYQPFLIALEDYFVIIKFVIVVLFSKECINYNYIMKYKKIVLLNAKLIVCFLAILSFANYLFVLWPAEIRYGMMSNRLFFTHPTYLSACCVFLYSLFCLFDDRKSLYTILLILLLFTTLRVKTIAAVLIILFLRYIMKKRTRPLQVTKLAILGAFSVLIAWSQIDYYFIEIKDSARNQLTLKSIEIAKDYFPFGTGLGTYGSFISGKYYSPVYYKYNLNTVYGLSKSDPKFMADNFWPMIIGQFGILGTIIYLMIILNIFDFINSGFVFKFKQLYISKMICFIYLIITSIAESAFVNPASISFAIIIGIDINKNYILDGDKNEG